MFSDAGAKSHVGGFEDPIPNSATTRRSRREAGPDGREQRTTLTDVNRCVGDIGDDNGAFTCSDGQPMAPYREDRR
jgi:hypothetical protein